jgi:aldehyde dehydrogenase (NAD+)
MKVIEQIYINGAFVKPHGTEVFDLISPVNQELLGKVILADETDTQNAISAAKKAFKTFSKTTKEERIGYLAKLRDAVAKRSKELAEVMILEYGGPVKYSSFLVDICAGSIDGTIELLKGFEFTKTMGYSNIELSPIGVVGIITPWNASNYYLCNKIGSAIAAGCTVVIKPSEMSAMQTEVFTQCVHEAGFPAGVINVVTGTGPVVGAEITKSPDVAKISFTGSTIVGKTIARDGAATMKRVTLELGGKSPNILLDDADFAQAIPFSVMAGYMNSGQACIAATRLLVPESRMEEAKALIKDIVGKVVVGDPQNIATDIGPMVSQKQYQRVQDYIQLGIDEGAEVLIGGLGQPAGLEKGNFIKPTVFVNVNNNMRIAREEIFGPVISIISFKDEQEAIEIANDTNYGLAAYVQSADVAKAKNVASQLEAGQVSINGFKNDPAAPFGGFKQSGLGRESGVYGLEAYLEIKAIMA